MWSPVLVFLSCGSGCWVGACRRRPARHTQRVMQQQLGRVPAITRRLDFVRDWTGWKETCGVTGISGITGKGSPHWYRFSPRPAGGTVCSEHVHIPRVSGPVPTAQVRRQFRQAFSGADRSCACKAYVAQRSQPLICTRQLGIGIKWVAQPFLSRAVEDGVRRHAVGVGVLVPVRRRMR